MPACEKLHPPGGTGGAVRSCRKEGGDPLPAANRHASDEKNAGRSRSAPFLNFSEKER